jgi:hypothetical protein
LRRETTKDSSAVRISAGKTFLERALEFKKKKDIKINILTLINDM